MTLTEKQARLAELRPLSSDSVASLARAWEVKMIYESNSIEGNSLTLRETELVLSKRVTVSGKPLKDHLEAVNLEKAWERVKKLARPGAEFSENDLLGLHRIIMTEVEGEKGGSYRTGTVRISGASHVPPNAMKVPDLMEELFAENHRGTAERRDAFAPLCAARIHHGIAAIHPFTDGNGRAARLAMNFILLSAGYPPISISPDLRQDYYAALEAADSGDFAAFQNFIETQLDRELDDYLETLSEPIGS